MGIIIAIAYLLVMFLVLLACNKNNEMLPELRGWYYAHRGLHGNGVPDNSMQAFRLALEKGYGIELDVDRTRDGALVVHHDDSLKRLTGVDIRIARSTLKEVRACKLPNGEPIPTYDEVLKTVAGRIPMVVEVKAEDGNHNLLSRAVYERMKRYNGPWCLESFDPLAVKWFRVNAPEVIRGQLAFDSAGKGKNFHDFMRNLGIASMLQNFASRPDFIAFSASSVKWHSLPIHLLRLMKPWFVAWTVRSQEDMDKLRSQWDLQIFEKFEAKKQ